VARLLIVEDERKILRGLERGLQAEDYEVVTAATGEAGYELAVGQAFDCMILDLLLPGRDGIQVLKDLRESPGKDANFRNANCLLDADRAFFPCFPV
jgi:DNA-binding response OmpR family regulator